MSHPATLTLLSKMCEQFDAEVTQWKNKLEEQEFTVVSPEVSKSRKSV